MAYKTKLTQNEDKYIHVPKSWYAPCLLVVFACLMVGNLLFFSGLKFNSEEVLMDALKKTFEQSDLFKKTFEQSDLSMFIQIVGFGLVGIALELGYGVLIGKLDKVLFGVLAGVLGGVLFGVLAGVLGGVLGSVLGGVLGGVLFGVLFGVL